MSESARVLSVRDVPRLECDELYVGTTLLAKIYRVEYLPMSELREAMRQAVRRVLEQARERV